MSNELGNEAAQDRLDDVLGLLRNQLADIAAMQKKQAALKLSARVADGTVEVTVNAQGQLVAAAIEASYLDDHDFDDLGDYITKAAQAAAQDAGRRVAEMLAPINERHKKFPSLSEIVEGMPDRGDLMPPGLDPFTTTPRHQEDPAASSPGATYDDGDAAGFPTVRR